MKPQFGFALREDLKEEKQFLPQKATARDTGYDVRSAQYDREPLVIKPFDYFMIPLGFRCYIPAGWWYELKPRSSTFAKKHIHALIGTIDEDFFKEAQFCGQYIPNNRIVGVEDLTINFGDAIGQIIPIERVEMHPYELSNKEIEVMFAQKETKRKGGFGSTGM